jgi:hypothetical protein
VHWIIDSTFSAFLNLNPSTFPCTWVTWRRFQAKTETCCHKPCAIWSNKIVLTRRIYLCTMVPTLQPGAALYMRHYSLAQKKSSALCLPSHLWSCVRADCCRTSVYAAPWTTTGSSLRTEHWTLRTPPAQHTCLMGSNRVHNSNNKWHRILKIHILLGCDAVSTGTSFRCLESLAKPLPTLGLVCVPIRLTGIT